MGVSNRSAEEAMEYYFTHESDPGFHDPYPEDNGHNGDDDDESDDDDDNESSTFKSSGGGSSNGASEAAAAVGAPQRKKKAVRVRRTPLELQRLFAQLQLASVRSVSTEQLTTKAFAFKDGDASVQHDAQVVREVSAKQGRRVKVCRPCLQS